jgi:hypothetical protein
MFQDWVLKCGYMELAEEPYQQVTSPVLAVGADQQVDIHELQLYHLDSSSGERRIADDMAHWCKRKQEFRDHLKILIQCSLGTFARMSHINVDMDGRIGPLLDAIHEFKAGSITLDNYSHYFGGSPCKHFMALLGREIQTSPTTHPICAYDPKVLLLMTSNGGAMARGDRKGLNWCRSNTKLSSSLFFHCVLLEVVKVEVLMEWSYCYHPGQPIQLPTLTEVPPFWISYWRCF